MDQLNNEEHQYLSLLSRYLQESRPLWHVVSALRGPDDGGIASTVKEATTAVIRYKIGLRAMNAGGFIVNPDTEEYKNIRINLHKNPLSDYHFRKHAQNAFDALGLKWDEVNL